MKRLFATFGAAIAGLAFTVNAAYADCGKVTISEMNWASAAIVTAVSKFLMEQGYGCQVAKVPTSTVPALASTAERASPRS
jgi:glycine betaine/proline transport system substrate-binding protein